jgi:hypothetical protein
MESSCEMEAAFHQLGWAQRPMTPPVEMTNLLHEKICHLDCGFTRPESISPTRE